ncbi:sporulation peptidase YabG [Halobacillus litoralis]|uniref:Sporulation peptidase YabG n=1 Tax=Halobacillus litoralis TaxID=45668 RepID=A0A845DWC1_9BACI|nr:MULTISPECIES: sporulation peptidase YabG [Halobacillus]MYL21961.1 sporulation peptidase YabG [Halobacillus litoralis]MYL31927.1 sporulation peptidase YabG [Halobacillus halophilus]MYL39761.1 sporulation peptidase YabG [Halobacillus litoralis]
MISNGDLVTRKSYQHDVIFRVKEKSSSIVQLMGEHIRLEADAPLEDVEEVTGAEYHRRKSRVEEQEAYSYRLFRQDYRLLREQREADAGSGYGTEEETSYFQIPPRILHIDGDPLFLKKCIALYEQLGLQVHGQYLHEKEMPHQVLPLIEKVHPEIVVLTGHDSYSKAKGPVRELESYRHSKYFVEAVRNIRRSYPNFDQLVVFAGACQSHFESIIRAGANFASSPSRVNIHAIDPVYVAARVAYTSFKDHINIWEVIRNTISGQDGLGGIETKGLLRIGIPYTKNQEEI